MITSKSINKAIDMGHGITNFRPGGMDSRKALVR